MRKIGKMGNKEPERGVFEIESIEKANADLIATIHESLQITIEGKRMRTASEADLQKLETELCDTLAPAKSACDQKT